MLTQHVAPGTGMAADLKAGKVETVPGSEPTVVRHGVIHVIDSVVIPK